MNIFADENIPQQIVTQLRAAGHKVEYVMQQVEVTAVFDFEFASIDLRVMELCVALSWWPANLMGMGKEWEVMDAFATACVAGFPLSEEELRAIPEVLRLRDAGSLVHRMERYFAGLETDATMQQRAEHTLWREAWLVAHREILLHHAMAWVDQRLFQVLGDRLLHLQAESWGLHQQYSSHARSPVCNKMAAYEG